MIVDPDGVIELPLRVRVFSGGFRIETYASCGVLVRRGSGFLFRDNLALTEQLAKLEREISIQEKRK